VGNVERDRLQAVLKFIEYCIDKFFVKGVKKEYQIEQTFSILLLLTGNLLVEFSMARR